MKIVLVGIFYPMAILRYFENALERRDDVELFTVGPHTGRWIPWNRGMYLSKKYDKAPSLVLPGRGQIRSIPISAVEARLPWEPDLWLQIDAGFFLHGRPRHGRNAIIGTDPHVLDYAVERRTADRFFCMQRSYAESEDVWLPYAYDLKWHNALSRSSGPLRNAILVGIPYGHRVRLVEALKRRGVDVLFKHGPVFEELLELYRSRGIGLNWSSLDDLNARVFETMACGLALVTNRVSDLGAFFCEGSHYAGFDTVDEAVEAVVWLANNDSDRYDMVRAAQAAVAPHTYDQRVQTIIEEVGLWP